MSAAGRVVVVGAVYRAVAVRAGRRAGGVRAACRAVAVRAGRRAGVTASPCRAVAGPVRRGTRPSAVPCDPLVSSDLLVPADLLVSSDLLVPCAPSAVPPARTGRRLSHPPSRPHRPHGGTARKGARDE